MLLLAMSLAAATATPPSTQIAPQQASEPISIYFHLLFPDRSTREHWQGERLDIPTLQEWSRGLAAAIADGSTMLRPVETRKEAKVIVEIRRCQVVNETEFIIAGIIKTETISEPFEIEALYLPIHLKGTIRGFENAIEHVLYYTR